MDSKLLEFTHHALARGIERPEIAKALQRAGWGDADIKAALGAFAEVAFPIPVPTPKPYVSAREVFTYLVFFSALYFSAFNLGSMTFTFIDLAFPDALQDGRFPVDVDGGLRWKLSTLIVAFPVFLFTFRAINKAVARDPTKRGSRPRKWLTCLTLFGAGVILGADVVALLYNLLGGELTIRFVLKVATVGILAGGIFAYFLPDIRQEDAA